MYFISFILLQIIIPANATDLSVLHYLHTHPGTNPAVLFKGLQNSFPEVKGQIVMWPLIYVWCQVKDE